MNPCSTKRPHVFPSSRSRSRASRRGAHAACALLACVGLTCMASAACGSSKGAGAAGGNDGGPGRGDAAAGGGDDGSGASGGSSGSSGGGNDGSAGSDAFGPSPDGGACSTALSDRVRITEVDVGIAYQYNEVDNNGAGLGLTPLALSPIPGGGSRLAFLGGDGMVHIATLDANDQRVGTPFGLPAYDFQDIYADAAGGVLLVSRSALGSTDNNNCGNIDNLCGPTTTYPTAASCYDMYMVRFDGTTETWATKLTDTTASLPAYGTSPTTGGNVVFIWSEYAHNGRIAFDGTHYAGYFGAAITVPGQACVNVTGTTGVNIHQGDRMKVVDGSGALQTTPGFSFGCSHSGYERVIWDPTAAKFVTVCKNDAPTGGQSGRIAFAPNTTTIDPVDLYYADLGSVLNAGSGGYWIAASDIRAGQTANAAGFADVHLLHVPSIAVPTPDDDILLVSDTENDRAPHLAAYGTAQILAAWEESTAPTSPPDSNNGGDLTQTDPNRQMYLQVLDSHTGAAPASSTTTSAGPLKLSPNVLGSRYQDFRAYPDGSVAYPAPGASSTSIKILRVLGCD
jgi:hypothetical protein